MEIKLAAAKPADEGSPLARTKTRTGPAWSLLSRRATSPLGSRENSTQSPLPMLYELFRQRAVPASQSYLKRSFAETRVRPAFARRTSP